MIDFDVLQRWRPENQETFVEALDREAEVLVGFKESGGSHADLWLAPVAQRYLFLCADLDVVIGAVRHIARAKRIAAERVRASKEEASTVVAEIAEKGWTFTAEDDEVWVYAPEATWETDDELHQIRDELAAIAERLVAPLVEAYEANRELNRQTYAVHRATSPLARPMFRQGRHPLSQRPTHVWPACCSSRHTVRPKPPRHQGPGDADASA